MKKCLLALAALVLVGCAGTSMPPFPETVKHHYIVDVRNQEVPASLINSIENVYDVPEMQAAQVARCLKFEIVQAYPYKIKYLSEVELGVCSGVGGYKPEDARSIYNWMDDVAKWAETRKKCFKQ